MKHFRPAIGVVGLVALLVSPAPVVRAQAQSDPHVGTWALNAAKSKYTPGPPPASQTSVYAVEGAGIKVTTKGQGPLGQPTSTAFTVAFDGKDHPVTGNVDYDAVAVKRVDSNTIEFTRKKGGQVVQTALSAVSKDGKTRTVTSTGVNARGAKVHVVGHYDRK